MKPLENEFNILSTLKQWSNMESLFTKGEGSGGLKRKPLLSKVEEVGQTSHGVVGAPKNLFESGLPHKGQFLEGGWNLQINCSKQKAITNPIILSLWMEKRKQILEYQ